MQNLNHEEQNLLKRIARDVSYITRDLHFGYLKQEGKIKLHGQPLAVIHTMTEKDLTIQQLAHSQDRSVHTINQHLASVRKALKVKTNHGAVYQAIRDGLIPCPCQECNGHREVEDSKG